jgi:hypothetical protein
MVYTRDSLLPSLALVLLVAHSLAGCSSSSAGQGAADGGIDSGRATDPPDAASVIDAARELGSCMGLCQAGSTTSFSCSSNLGAFTIQVQVAPSTCSNYSVGGAPVCSPTQTTLNAAINLDDEELDCDGTIRDTDTDPCRALGTWSLQGDTLTLNLTDQQLAATCKKQ